MLNPYHNAIRQYCELQARRGLTGQYIRYQVLPDEISVYYSESLNDVG